MESRKKLERYKVAELKERAIALGLTVPEGAFKKDIITLILKGQSETTGQEEPRGEDMDSPAQDDGETETPEEKDKKGSTEEVHSETEKPEVAEEPKRTEEKQEEEMANVKKEEEAAEHMEEEEAHEESEKETKESESVEKEIEDKKKEEEEDAKPIDSSSESSESEAKSEREVEVKKEEKGEKSSSSILPESSSESSSSSDDKESPVKNNVTISSGGESYEKDYIDLSKKFEEFRNSSQEKIEEKDVTIEILKRKIADTESRSEQLNIKLNEVQSKLGKMMEVDEHKHKMDELSSKHKTEVEVIRAEAEKQKIEAEKQNKTEKQKLNESVKALEEKLGRKKAKIAAYKKLQLEDAKGAHEDEMMELKEEIISLKVKLDEKEGEIARHNEKEEDIDDLKEELRVCKRDLKIAIDKEENSTKDFLKQLFDAKDEMSRLQDKISSLNTHILTLLREKEEFEDTINDFTRREMERQQEEKALALKKKSKSSKKSKSKALKRPSGRHHSTTVHEKLETHVAEADTSENEFEAGSIHSEEIAPESSKLSEPVEPSESSKSSKSSESSLYDEGHIEAVEPEQRQASHQPRSITPRSPKSNTVEAVPIYRSPSSKLSVSHKKLDRQLNVGSPIPIAYGAGNSPIRARAPNGRHAAHVFLHYRKLGANDSFYQKLVVNKQFKDVFFDKGRLVSSFEFKVPTILYLLESERLNDTIKRKMTEIRRDYSEGNMVYFRYVKQDDLLSFTTTPDKAKHVALFK